MVHSFPKGTAAGPSGLRAQHLLEALTSAQKTTVLEQLAGLCYLLASGQAPAEVHSFLCGATLMASPNQREGFVQLLLEKCSVALWESACAKHVPKKPRRCFGQIR